jgi:2-polyprenyl-3-methyl-5-hydroxy-6-metoxy-1,4-benzoquinol methylase
MDTLMNTDKYVRTKCRYCDEKLDQSFLDLGTMALANSFVLPDAAKESEFTCPLKLVQCNTCKLVQLTHTVPASVLFSEYLYVSSTTKTFQAHFAEYAASVQQKLKTSKGKLAVDIGSNDGLLLSCFEKEGMKAIGIEPAANIAAEANERGLKTINKFFSRECVDEILKTEGHANTITANNVFAHVDDVQDVCRNVSALLATDGMFVIEFPYLGVMMDEMLFDMVYHEHLSYISVTSLTYLLGRFKLEIFDITPVASHGGSLRVFIQKAEGQQPISKTVAEYLKNESGRDYLSPNACKTFAGKVQSVKADLIKFVSDLKNQHKTIAGYGAPAKGNTIINYCGLTSDHIDYIVDDNPLKQGRLSPGARIPVVPSSRLRDQPTDYVIIFAWNFAKEIIQKIDFLKAKGVQFIIPLPRPKII